MQIYLTHPDHGTHIAYSDQEVERCKANGWVLRKDSSEIQEPRQKRKYTRRAQVTDDNGN